MKKFLVAILSILYLASTSGATVHFHYCMGELVDAKFTQEKKEKCSKCGMVKKKSGKGCCQDVHKLVKVEQGHEKGIFDMPSFLLQDVFLTHTDAYSFTVPSARVDNNPATGPPPLISTTPLFIRYCNFRI